ncbi:MAG TPA: LptF/LptG family permease [Deltaproteobacteria bacterium]|nr:LptF/LptG family permease [Deltaproteobacteria bacterium]HPP79716.1 LptF/LptG family permease [Deltaproteobacteria bacterium]
MIVARYMFGRLLAVFSGTAAALFGVMFAVQWMRLGRALGIGDVDILLLTLVPLSTFVIPMSLLFTVLLVLEKLSVDSEIVAMRASGVRDTLLFMPIVVFSLCLALVHLAVSTTIGPLAMKAVHGDLMRSAPRKMLAFFKEREFNDRFRDLVLYVESVNQRKRQLKGVFLEGSKPGRFVVSARRGNVEIDGTRVTLILKEGGMFSSAGDADRYLTFDEYSFTLQADLEGMLRIKSYDTATQGEFRRLIEQDPSPKRVREYHNRYAFPVINILLAAIGIVFGVQNPRSPRYTGFLIGMATIVAYYLSNVMSARLVAARVMDPVLGAWLADICFATFLVLVVSFRRLVAVAKRGRAWAR